MAFCLKPTNWFITVGAALLLSGCGNQGDEHATGTSASQLFDQYCSGCHGPQGQGIFIKGTPAINNTQLSEEQVVTLIIHGDQDHKMPEFPKMNREDAESVARQVMQLPTQKSGR